MSERPGLPVISLKAAPVERDYLERTIATVRNHREADNCWPQWANIFADEIERLWSVEADRDRLREIEEAARDPFLVILEQRGGEPPWSPVNREMRRAADRLRAALNERSEDG